jgi:PAS domain S-box-containing protein
MQDENKTKAQLLEELKELRQRVAIFENPLPASEMETIQGQFKLIATLIAATPHPMALKDENSIYFAVNRPFSEFFGKQPDEMIGRSDFDLFLTAAQMNISDDRAILCSGKALSKDFEGEGHSGKQYWKIVKTPLADIKTGTNRGILCSITDISKFRQVETALRESENRFSSLVQHMASGVIVYTSQENGKNFKIKSINPAAAQMSCVLAAEIVGGDVLDVLPDFQNTELFATLKKVWETGEAAYLPALCCDNPVYTRWREYRIYRLPSGELVTIFEDITQRMQALFNMLEQEKLLRSIAENYPNSYISIIDKNLNIAFTAGEEYKKQNLNPDQFIGLAPEQVFGNNGAAVRKFYQKTFAGEACTFEFMNNNQIQFLRTVPLVSENGANPRILAVVENITDRKRTELELRESEERYRLLVETSIEGIWAMNRNHQTTFINAAMAGMLGYAPAEMLGRKVEDFFFAEDMTLHNSRMEKRHRGVDEVYERRFRRRDGTSLWTLVSAKALKDDQGRFSGSFAMFTDITEHKQAEEALRESEDRYRLLLEAIRDSVFVLDKEWRHTLVNDATEQFTNIPRKTLLGNKLADLFPGIENTPFFRTFRQVMETRMPDVVVAEHQYADGRKIWYEVHVSPVPEGILCISRNITERKQAEEEKNRLESQLRRSQKLETIGTLAGGIAHDFNNILTPIMGYTDMALSAMSPSNPLYEDLQHILKGANRAKDLVQQILTFSRQTERERIPINLHLIVDEALKLLRPAIPATIEIHQRIDSACEKVLADATQMHQIIINLCTNSFHAMEGKGGVLTIELKQVKVDMLTAKFNPNLEEKEYVRLTVSDTGEGMDETTLDRIFDPFFTTKPVNKGTGLGLSVVHGIVRGHEGAIVVSSERNKGTTVHVYLPTLTTRLVNAVKIERTIPGGSEKILLVDDEVAVAGMLVKLLERLGYAITLRTSSIEALKVFREQPDAFNLVITDLTMPNMTGLDLAQQIHKIHGEIPIILITGYDENVTGDLFPQFGIHEVIGKPFDLRKLAHGIRKVLKQQN